MNRSIKVLSIAAYYLFSQAIFEFHLEKMTRLWRRSNFGANFWFLRKKWTGDLPNYAASFGTTSNQKEQCPENTASAVKHLSVSKYFFTTLWGRALSWRRITLSCLCSYFSRFSCNARLKRINCSRYRLPVMESPGFIVNKTFLVPPNTEHDLRTMNVRPWCWYWGRWTGLSVVFFLLEVVVEYPLLISSHNLMQKNLFFVVFKSAVHKWKIAFQRFSVSVHKAPNFLVFEFPMALNRTETACWVMILQAPLAFDSNLLRVMPLILCFLIFMAVQSEACFQISILETSKPFPDLSVGAVSP